MFQPPVPRKVINFRHFYGYGTIIFHFNFELLTGSLRGQNCLLQGLVDNENKLTYYFLSSRFRTNTTTLKNKMKNNATFLTI